MLDVCYFSLAFPAIIRMTEITHDDQGLKTLSFFKLPEEGLIYFFLMRESAADTYNNAVRTSHLLS